MSKTFGQNNILLVADRADCGIELEVNMIDWEGDPIEYLTKEDAIGLINHLDAVFQLGINSYE